MNAKTMEAARRGMALRSLHHRARTGAIVAVLLGLSLGYERDADAHCVDVGCIVGWVWVVAVPVVIAGATVFFIDVYETSVDIGEAGKHKPPSLGRSTFETGWGGTQAAIGGTVAVALVANDDVSTAFGVLALSSWPLALGMHGAWAQKDDPYGSFPGHVVPVAGLDLVVAGYDVARFVRRDRPSGGYGFAEMLGALPQVGFGIAAAAGGRSADVPLTLALTALPTLLLAHGIYEMAAKPRPEPSYEGAPPPPPPPPPTTWRLVPTLGRDATGSSLGVSVVGRF